MHDFLIATNNKYDEEEYAVLNVKRREIESFRSHDYCIHSFLYGLDFAKVKNASFDLFSEEEEYCDDWEECGKNSFETILESQERKIELIKAIMTRYEHLIEMGEIADE